MDTAARACIPLVLGLVCVLPAFAEDSWEHGGFLRESGQIFAKAPNPSDAYAEGSTHLQLWSRAIINKTFFWRGTIDFQVDTHRNVDRGRWGDTEQRGLRQPAGAISEFYLDAKFGRFDLRVGRQRIRWGRADGFNPTDNILPYDYLDTFSDERLPVTAFKGDAYFGKANFEGVWEPFFAPTRLPLLGQRWFPRLPVSAYGYDLEYRDLSGPLPARTAGNSQWGVRYNQVLSKGEFSFSYFDGFDDIPFFRSQVSLLADGGLRPPRALVSLSREYYRVHVAGLDFATEIGPFGLRGEAAYFDQTDPNNLDHLLYIIGLDKTWGDWFAILQFAGQKTNGQSAGQVLFPDLGLRSTMICRIEHTLGPSRSIEIKGALRLRDGDFFLQPVYSIALSNGWRLKVGSTVFAGAREGYIGQFRDSSHVNLQLTYSF